MYKTLFVLTLIALLSVTTSAKQRVAIAEAINNTQYSDISNAVETEYREIFNLFARLGYFEIIERNNLDVILSEQSLTLQGLTANEVLPGQIANVEYIVLPSLASLIFDNSDGNVNLSFDVQIKILDCKSGSIKYSEIFKLSGKNELYSDINRADMVDKIMQNLGNIVEPSISHAFPLTGYVIKVIDRSSFVIDLGTESGLAIGQILTCFTKGDDIKHPVTGAIIPGEEIAVGKLEIINISSQTATVSPKTQLKSSIHPGMIVKKVVDQKIAKSKAVDMRQDKVGKSKRWFFGITYKNIPMAFSNSGFNLTYFDGYDNYIIKSDSLSITRANVPGLTLNLAVVRLDHFEAGIGADFGVKLANTLYGFDFGGNIETGVRFGPAVILVRGGGAGGNLFKKIGKVGIGDSTGSQIMLAPNGEAVPSGTDIMMKTAYGYGFAGPGIRFYPAPYVQIDVFADIFFSNKVDKWVLYAPQKQIINKQTGQKELVDEDVILGEDDFTENARLGTLDVSGFAISCQIGFKF
jgi:hypothetical protein